MDVDIRQMLRSALRWWWLILAIPVIAGVLAYLYTDRQEPRYRAEASLQVSTSANTDNTYNVLLGSERQAKTYQRLATDPAILERAGTSVDPPVDPVSLAKKIRARTEEDTSLLIVGVSDTDPARAAILANAVADALVAEVEARTEENTVDKSNRLQVEIDVIGRQILEKQTAIANLEAEPDAGSLEVRAQIANLNEDIDRLEETVAVLQQEQGRVLVSGGDELRPFTSASAPLYPYAPRKALNLLLGLFAGAVLAAGVVLMLEYLDNTIKATADFPALVGGPLLATVRSQPRLKAGPGQLFVLDDPTGSAAESIRLLRTNIEFASISRELVAIGITSASPSEGKSTIAANLAVALAQSGFVTALVDADLRRPTQHRIFGLTNDRGLSTLLTYAERPWSWGAHGTMLPNLQVVPAGPVPPNPADLLSLDRLRLLIDEMRETVDVMVIDSPPVLAVSDPLILSAHIDGMIMVSLGGKTRIDALRRAAATLQQSGVRIVGAVLNQHGGKETGYYYADYRSVSGDGPRGFRRRRGTASDATGAASPSVSAIEGAD